MKTGMIDWTDHSLTLFIFQKKGTQCEPVDTRSTALENGLSPDVLRSLIPADLEEVHLSVPVGLLTLRTHAFPFSERDKIRDTIAFELEGILLGSTDDYAIDHIVTAEHDTGSEVLAVCLEKARLRGIIDVFAAAGAEPGVVTSIDLGLSGGRPENLLEKTESDASQRADAAQREIVHPTVNLRQGELAYTGDIDRMRKRLKWSALLLLIFFVLIGVHTSLNYITARSGNRLLSQQIDTLYRSVFPQDRKIVDAARQFRANLNAMTRKRDQLRGIPVLDMLRSLSLQKEARSTLHEFSADGKNMIIKGTTGSFEDVEAVKNSLQEHFREVRISDSKATADNKISFTIVMQEQ